MKLPKVNNANDALKYTAVAALGIFGIYKVVQNYNKNAAIRSDEEEARKRGLKLSYPLTNYNGFADALYEAGFGTAGTDEDTIYAIMNKMLNDLDILALYKAFDKRRIEFSLTDVDLIGYLSSELNTTEIQKVNDILMKNGVKFRF